MDRKTTIVLIILCISIILGSVSHFILENRIYKLEKQIEQLKIENFVDEARISSKLLLNK